MSGSLRKRRSVPIRFLTEEDDERGFCLLLLNGRGGTVIDGKELGNIYLIWEEDLEILREEKLRYEVVDK